METNRDTTRKMARRLAAAFLVTAGSQAMADSCTSYIANLYAWLDDQSATGYNVQAVRVTARDGGGFSSFSMDPSYTPSMGISTRPSPRYLFHIGNDGTGTLTGQFQDVFPGRTDGSSDLTTLRIRRPTVVQLRFDDWGGGLATLTGLQCFPGNFGRSFVMTGRSSAWGVDLWSFVIIPTWFG